MTDQNPNQQEDSLIDFPCDFPIKVMGKSQVDFGAEIIRTIQKLDASFDASKVEIKASSKGNYISLTC